MRRNMPLSFGDGKMRAACIGDTDILQAFFATPHFCAWQIEIGDMLIYPSLPDGRWTDQADIIHILGIKEFSALSWCVETAWRNHIPVMLTLPDGYIPFKKNDRASHFPYRDVCWESVQELFAHTNYLIVREWEASGLLSQGFLLPPREEASQFLRSYASSKSDQPHISRIIRDYLPSGIYQRLIAENADIAERNMKDRLLKRIYVDITTIANVDDLAGIPRVEMDYGTAIAEHFGERCSFVKFDPETGVYWIIPASEFSAFVELYKTGKKYIFINKVRELLEPGSTIICFGLTWYNSGAYLFYLNQLALHCDISLIYLVYDFYYQKFPLWLKTFGVNNIYNLCSLSEAVAYLISISLSTKGDVRKFLVSKLQSIPPINNIRLGDNTSHDRAIISRSCSGALVNNCKKFILMVSNDSYHKNHLLMYQIYIRLLQEYDSEDVPHLICVGGKWFGNVVLDMLSEDPQVNTHVHIFSNITDEELDSLYRNCLFTVYPSLYEGWGLPVSESLCYGKVCIASMTSSIPEIAPRCTDLLDPHDFRAWYDRIRHYVFNPEALKQREKEIIAYQAFSWKESGQILCNILEKQRYRKMEFPILPLDVPIDLANPESFHYHSIFAAGSELTDKGGVWLNGVNSKLVFRLKAKRDPAILELKYSAFSECGESLRVGIELGGYYSTQYALCRGEGRLRIFLPTSADNSVPFENMTLFIANIASPLEQWSAGPGPTGFWVQGINCRIATKEEVIAGRIVQVAVGLMGLEGGNFYSLLLEGHELAYFNCENPYSSALKLIMWAWLEGIQKDPRLAAIRRSIFMALCGLRNVRPAISLVPEYTGLVHAFWLFCKQDIAPVGVEEQKAIAGDALRYLGSLASADGAGAFYLANQTECTRNYFSKIQKSGEQKRKSVLVGFETMNKLTGFLPLSGFDGPEPTLKRPVSQLVTASQFQETIYVQRCAEIGERIKLRRKQWEFVYILQALLHHGAIHPGARGIGFGCGTEPLPSVFAERGCIVTATDYPQQTEWIKTGEQALKLKDLWHPQVIAWSEFEKRVQFNPCDMNHISAYYNEGYDFTWSACALEHLGSINNGLNFIINSVKCLKPGGIAVHTTELNLSDLEQTFQSQGCSFFRKKDFQTLNGHPDFHMIPINWSMGHTQDDKMIDVFPFKARLHMKLMLAQHIITSIGLIFIKNKR